MTLGVIGTGNNGTNWMKRFLKDPRVRVVAVCDVNRESGGYWDGTVRGREPARRLVDEHYGDSSCQAYDDYREVLARDDIDAIYIGTPDHWHAMMAVDAAHAGKHIYGQKPLSRFVSEGRRMVEAVETSGKVWQTGSQQRSDLYFLRVCELVRQAAFGRIRAVQVGLPGGTPDYGKVADQTETVPVPDGLSYDKWLGPAPLQPYCPARVGVNFRWVLDYSGGQVTDWGAHHIDIAHLGLGRDKSGPVAIKNARGKFAPGPVYDTATEFHFEAHYADDVKVVVSNENRMGVRFEGDDGWVWVSRGGKWESSDTKLLKKEAKRIKKQKKAHTDHVTNFVDAVLDGGAVRAPIEAAHRSVSVAHLGNIALRQGRDLRWDPVREEIVDDAGSAAMLTRDYRDGYALS